MIKEVENQKYIIINNIKVFVGLPVISKKTIMINKTDDIKIIRNLRSLILIIKL